MQLITKCCVQYEETVKSTVHYATDVNMNNNNICSTITFL